MKNFRIVVILISIGLMFSSCSRRYGHLTGFQFGSKSKAKTAYQTPSKHQRHGEVSTRDLTEVGHVSEENTLAANEVAAPKHKDVEQSVYVHQIEKATSTDGQSNQSAWKALKITKSVAAAATKSKRIEKKLRKQLMPDQAKDGGLLYLLIVIILVLVIISLLAGILGKLWPVIATVLIVLLILYLLGML